MNHENAFRGIPYAGLAALKLAARITPESLGGKVLRREFARKLVEMRGVPMKMAQILSMSKNDAQSTLQREALIQVDPAPASELIARLTASAPDLSSEITEFCQNGIAASLGQVHKVRLRDGRVCALKMKHAGIGRAMDLDSELMAFMVSVFGHFREGFSIDAFKSLLTQELKAELDYPYEIRRQGDLREGMRDVPGIIIPKPYPMESGDEHLLMDWEPSIPIGEFAISASEGERKEAAALLARFHIHSLFREGQAHADPNPGNFGLRRGGKGIELVVYDFGSLIPLEDSLTQGMARLIHSVRLGRDPLPDLLGMGFRPEPISAIADRIPALCRILLEPFLVDGGFRIASWDRRRRVMDLLGAERWNLMIAAPPASFFVMRALHGLFHYGGILGGYLELGGIIPEPAAPAEAPRKVAEKPDAQPETENPGRAVRLRVKLSKNKRDVVSVTMPGDAVNRLDQVMEPGLLQSLRAGGIDVDSIAEAAGRNGFRAMELFAWSDGSTSVRIWLE